MAFSPDTFRKQFADFLRWVKETVVALCNRPDHLQRLAIIGAGVSVYPLAALVIGIIWRGYDRTAELQSQSLAIMGIVAFILLALFGLVVVSLLNTIKGLRISGPGGIGLELSTVADDPDVDPSTTRSTGLTPAPVPGGYIQPTGPYPEGITP